MAQAHPGLTAASYPWPSGAAFKRMTLGFPYTAGALVYVRDRGSGRVYLGSDGLPRIRYWPCEFDRQSMLKVGPPLPFHAYALHNSCWPLLLPVLVAMLPLLLTSRPLYAARSPQSCCT